MSKEDKVEKLKRLIKCGYLDIDSSIIEALNYILYENEKLKDKCKELIKEKQELTTILEDDVKAGVYIDYPEFEEKYISKDKIKEIFEILNNITSRTDGKVNAWDYMIIGETERAVGRFINLDYIEKIIFEEEGYGIGEKDE